MSSSSLTPEEIRAAAETHHELGHEYSSAVIDSFLEKVGREIDARVDAQLNRHAPAVPHRQGKSPAAADKHGHGTVALGIFSLILSIPITAIVAYSPAHLTGLIVVWVAIAVINIAYASRSHDH